MSLVKTTGAALADRLKNNLRTKYGMGATAAPDTMCLLLDISGSMTEAADADTAYQGKSRVVIPASPGQQRIDKLNELIVNFQNIRRFSFSHGCSELGPSETHVYCDGGGTNMANAFLTLKRKGIKHAIMVTDGEPDSEQLAIQAAQGLKIDCFYVGPDPAPPFLEILSQQTGGSYGKASLLRIKELTAAVKERLMLSAPTKGIQL